jgi:hypothetical protein
MKRFTSIFFDIFSVFLAIVWIIAVINYGIKSTNLLVFFIFLCISLLAGVVNTIVDVIQWMKGE